MRVTNTHMHCVLILVAILGLGCEQRGDKTDFSAAEVAQIRSLLKNQGTDFTPATVDAIKAQAKLVEPENYRFVLPVFDRERLGTVVGSETIGKLPVTEVQRLASVRGVRYDENANAQAVIWQNDEQGGATKSNGGCQSDHSTPAKGLDIGHTVYHILEHIDKSRYVFLH